MPRRYIQHLHLGNLTASGKTTFLREEMARWEACGAEVCFLPAPNVSEMAVAFVDCDAVFVDDVYRRPGMAAAIIEGLRRASEAGRVRTQAIFTAGEGAFDIAPLFVEE